MTCFPLDNTLYEAKDMGAYLATRTRGVFSAENNLAVTPGESELSVFVSPGLAWLRWSEFWGACALQEQTLQINLDAADGVLQRIDAIVCRLDKVNNRAEIVAKKGAFSSNPVVEPPVRNANYDEIYLATVQIGAGAISISAADITDQRLNEAYCGLMRDGVTGIPTAQLHAQWAAFFAQVQQNTTDKQQQADAAFAAWFDHMKELFAEDPPGSLQTQIDALQEQKADRLDQEAINSILLADHPVGCLYLSGDPTSPAILFGGTWIRLTNAFIWALADGMTSGTTGGSSTINLQHKHSTGGHAITKAELPNVLIDISIYAQKGGNLSGGFAEYTNSAQGATYNTSNLGNGQAHYHGDTGMALSTSQSIMPPYIAKYCWERTA